MLTARSGEATPTDCTREEREWPARPRYGRCGPTVTRRERLQMRARTPRGCALRRVESFAQLFAVDGAGVCARGTCFGAWEMWPGELPNASMIGAVTPSQVGTTRRDAVRVLPHKICSPVAGTVFALALSHIRHRRRHPRRPGNTPAAGEGTRRAHHEDRHRQRPHHGRRPDTRAHP